MSDFGEAYERTVRLIGSDALTRLQNSFVALVGLGGVGGHCAEALARAGIGRMHLVDNDVVAVSNLNRQLVATKSNIGKRKTDELARRIREVSDCCVTTSDVFITPETVDDALPKGLTFLADAIDFVPGKLALARYAETHGIPIVSCMGAGNRLDPTRFRVADIFTTQGDPLARSMRQGLRKLGIPKLAVVLSDEPPRVEPGQRVIGSFAPVTAAAGLTLAASILNGILSINETPNDREKTNA